MSADRLREAAAALRGEDAAHIAAMHPPVALALADWLDVVAAWQDEGLGRVPGLDRTNWPDMWTGVTREALAVADAILGVER